MKRNLLSIYFLVFLIAAGVNVYAQTPGLIFKPATGAGKAVLDPNGDGYVSTTTAGFTTNDKTQSEIPYVAMVFPMIEPTSDLGPGPDCGFTDFVDSGAEDPALSYFNGTNFMFRLRIGNAFPNSKGYSILIDTDEKFGLSGPNADPNATISNPGFEIEINLQTNFGVFVYNVDGVCPSSASSSFAGETNYQKSVAYTTNCSNPDYFYDFYVPFSALTALGITSSTPLRMAVVTQMNPSPGICNSALSDFGGIDDSVCGSNPYVCWGTIIDNYPPTCATCTPGGDRSSCPGITSPISNGATSVSGTSSETSGTTIKIYKDGSLIGSTTVSSGTWSLAGISPALAGGNVITATATALGESESIANCNPVTVALTCSSGPPNATVDDKGICGTGATVGALIRVYKEGVLQTPDATGSAGASGTTVTVQSDGSWRWKCNSNTTCNGGGNCLLDGYYTFTMQVSGQCESVQSLGTCFNGNSTSGAPSTTATPVITTTTIQTTTTSVSGTSASGATIYLYANGTQIGTTTASGTSWTISSLSFTLGQVISAKAILNGQCISTASTSVTVTYQTSAPTVTGTYCTTSTITSITGTSTEAAGTVIQVFKNSVAHGSTTTVGSNGTWTATTGISFSVGDIISAKATASGGVQSEFSNTITVGTKTTNAVAITTNPITEGGSSVSGTGTNGDVIKLYIDGIQIGSSATVASGTWTVSSLSSTDLYAGGSVTATATSSGNCESNASSAIVVSCVPPGVGLSVSPDNATICSGTTVSNIQVTASQSNIIYQLYNGASTSGSSVLGTGGTISLTSAALSASTTLSIKAIKIGGVTCESTLSETVGVTVNPNPTTSLTVTTDAATVCSGTGTNVNVAGSQTDFSYQLRDNASNALIGSAVVGTGSSIALPTGNLSANTTFNILVTGAAPSNCSATLSALPMVSIVASPTAAAAGNDQTVCSTTGTTSMTGNTPSVGIGSWSQISGPATATIAATSDPLTSITGLTSAGTYRFQWTISNSPCTASADLIDIVVNDPPTTANAGSNQAICSGSNATLNANIPGVGVGTWSLVSGPSTNLSQFSNTASNNATFTPDGGAGNYVLRWTISNSSCATSSADVTITVTTLPSTPTVSSITQPTCGTPTGTIVFATQAGVEYGLNGTYQASATFSGLSAATYTLSVRSTANNSCITNAASTVTINAASTAPSVPSVSSTTQPTCVVPTGAIVFSTQAGVEYSVGSGYQASETFSGLTAGTYTLSVRSSTDNTCATNAASTVTINAPSTPSVPLVSFATQPTCAVPTGTIVFNTQAGVEYSVGSGYQSSETFSGLTADTYTLSVRSTMDNTCVTNAASTVTINAAPSAPSVPSVSSVTQPTCAVPTGTIVFNTQVGVEYSVGSGYLVSETFSGLTPGTYTLLVRNTTDNTCATNAASTVTINAAPSAPSIPSVSSTTQPTCAVPTGTIVFNTQAGVEYSVGSGYQASETFSGLTAGTYALSVRSTTDNTCVTNAASTVTINAAPSAPSVPTVSSTIQPTCAVPTGTIVFSTQAGVEYSVGSGYQASEAFSGLTAGTYTLSVRSTTDNTCVTNAASAVIINAVPSAPSVPTVSSTTQPTCAVPTGTIVFNTQAGVEYSVGSGYQASETFSGLTAGTYTLSVRGTTDNTCVTNAASAVTINVAVGAPAIPTVSSTTQPTCAVPTGTIVFNTQAGVEYSVGSGYQASETFNGLTAGTYTLSVRSTADNTCVTNAASTITINATPSVPSVPTVSVTTQPTCAVPTGTIVFNTLAGVEYSVGSGYQASETFSGLVAGTYTLSVRNTTDNTCVSIAASTVTINAAPSAPSIPTVSSTTQPTCAVPTGTIVFNTQAGVEYSVGSGYQASETFSGLLAGTYTLSVRSTADNTCVSNSASTVTINVAVGAPTIPTVSSTTQPTCAVPTGTIVFNTQAGVEYSVGSGYQASETFIGLAAGTYTLSVRSTADNTCVTNAASTVTINATPSAPSVPTVSSTTQPTCAVPTGSIVFSTQLGVEYSVGSGYQASETFSGLTAGTYTLSVRSTTDNTCVTNAASAVIINAAPSAPSVPTVSSTTQPTCAVPTGTIVFSTQAGVEYSVGSGYQASETFSGLTAGTYTLSVRSTTDNTCVTNAASTVTINTAPTAPSVPTVSSTTQPTCAVPTGTIVFSTQAGVEYSVGSGYQASETFSGLTIGTYTLSVRSTTDNTCVTNAASTVTINVAVGAPAIPTVSSTTQPTCAVPTGTIVFNTQADVEYSVGSGYQASETFNGLTAGTYTLSVRSTADNTCVTNAASTITINVAVGAPAIPTVSSTTQPTCAVPTGTIVFNTQAGVEYSVGSGYQTSEIFSGLTAGTYTLLVRSTTDNTCATNAASTVTINVSVGAPAIPTISSTAQPTCAVPTGTIVLNTQAGVEYSAGSGYQSSETFNGLTVGTYTLSVRSTADNTCVTNAASTVTINTAPSAPSVPTVSSTIQPTCAVPNGTIVFNTQAGVEYSVGSGYQSSETFSGLTAGTYTLSVRSTTDNTCVTNAASTVIINAAPSAPSVPTVSSTTQPTCAVPTGTIVFSTQAGVEYSVGSDYQTSETFSGLISGVYTLSVRSTTDNTCDTNAASTVTINAAPSAPSVPTVSSTTQPTCAVPTGTVVFNTQAGVEYSVGSGYQASETFSGLTSGTYSLSVRSTTDNTCVTNASSTVIINAVPNAVISYSGSPFSSDLASAQNVTLTGTTGGTFNSTAGLSINSVTGEVTPILSTPGSYTINYDISASTCATASITIFADTEAVYTVDAAQNVVTYVNGETLAGVTDANGFITSVVVSAGSLPAGTTINTSTGEIMVSNNTLLLAGSYTLDITTTDITGGTTTQTVTLIFTGEIEAVYSVDPAQNVISYANGESLATVTDDNGVITSAVVSSGSLPSGTTINPITGEITVSDVTLLVAGTYSFGVTTTDITGGTTTQTVTLVFNASNPPVANDATVALNENSPNATVVHTVVASDIDPGDVLTYSISAGNTADAFMINPTTGVITINNTSLIDFEINPVFTLTVKVTDAQGNTDTAIITINLTDLNNEDTDLDGIPDSIEKDSGTPIDSDGDGVPDFKDVDSDNDGIPDSLEAGSNLQNPVDTDGDGVDDFRDTDSDNDSVDDSIESGGEQPSGNDTDDDGLDDTFDPDQGGTPTSNPQDSDNDGTDDFLDTDDDDDGIPTLDENVDNDDDSSNDNTDDDDLPDYLDNDDDNDGEPTAEEDNNVDGNFFNDDCDGDTTPDYRDADQCKVKPGLGFSPNGDSDSDKWKIDFIKDYPNNSVKVFNRWGNQVYETNGYDNEENAWGGQSKGKLTIGDLSAPDGTYFYVIDLGDGSKLLAGYVIIKR
jgi:gliding motility-associated-like protein